MAMKKQTKKRSWTMYALLNRRKWSNDKQAFILDKEPRVYAIITDDERRRYLALGTLASGFVFKKVRVTEV